MKMVKIVVYVPIKYSEKIRNALAEIGAGHIGNYDYCTFSIRGVGRFRPLKGTKPFIGHEGEIEEVEEERIETVCPCEKMDEVIDAVKKVHPYEEPAVDVFPLLNFVK